MAPADQASSSPPEPSEAPRPRTRIRRAFSGSRELVRIAYRDPEHVAERLTLFAADRYGAASQEWAQSARSARIQPKASGRRLGFRWADAARLDRRNGLAERGLACLADVRPHRKADSRKRTASRYTGVELCSATRSDRRGPRSRALPRYFSAASNSHALPAVCAAAGRVNWAAERLPSAHGRGRAWRPAPGKPGRGRPPCAQFARNDRKGFSSVLGASSG